jgi:hypothetical protein
MQETAQQGWKNTWPIAGRMNGASYESETAQKAGAPVGAVSQSQKRNLDELKLFVGKRAMARMRKSCQQTLFLAVSERPSPISPGFCVKIRNLVRAMSHFSAEVNPKIELPPFIQLNCRKMSIFPLKSM